MCSKILVPRVVLYAFLLVLLGFSVLAQTRSLSEAWKISNKSSSESANNSTKVTSTAAKQTTTSNTARIASAAWSATTSTASPVEPRVKPANPPLALDAEAAAIKRSKLETNPNGEDLVGIEPPATYHATAYSLRGVTRSGTRVRRGVIAADPRVLPLGSVVHLKAGNYSGVYTVHDTGGSIKGKRIDVWMPSSREARSFGRQNVRLTVLKYGGGRKPKTKR